MEIDRGYRAAKRFREARRSGYHGDRPKVTGASGQYTVVRRRFGRRKSAWASINKLIRRDAWFVRLQMRNVAPFNATNATCVLYNYKGGTSIQYPIHLYAIDMKPPTNNDGTGNNGFFVCTASTTTNRITWQGVPVDNPVTGAAGAYNGMTCVYNSQGNTNSIPNYFEKSVLTRVKADFILRGIASRPTRYTIQFVQFLHPDIHPTAAASDEGTKFWQDMAKPLLVSPLSGNPPDTHKAQHMRVLKTYSMVFQPDETNNKDAVPVQRRFTIDFYPNRLCDYSPRSSLASTAIANLQDQDGIQLVNENNANYTGQYVFNPKARVYMLIKAAVYDVVSDTTAASLALMPQYDVVINSSHTLQY